ncbi:MAG: GNAT family N-acetyltransferase [Chloroflexi bacterium]|nr:GNAT family N-acetyltransferase [Chloroflexota bacterium]
MYEQSQVFDELASEWNDLLKRSATDAIFCTWEWQSAWWQTYDAGKLWVVACRDDDGRLIGIAPWFIQPKEGESVVRTIGCVDVTDYVDLIIDHDHIDAVLDEFAGFLVNHRDAYDRVNLCNIPETSPTYALFVDKLKARGLDAKVELQEVCPVIKLPGTWDEYLDSLDKKQRGEIRRKLRRAEGEGDIEWYIVGREHDQNAEFDRFLDLMAASHPEKREFLNDPKNLAFFKCILPLMAAQGWLKLSFLKVNGTAAATYCDFDYNNQILVYNSGLDPNAYAQLSPGIVLLSYNIRAAIETGHSVFDFLRGNETYKYRMGGQDTRVYMLLAQ